MSNGEPYHYEYRSDKGCYVVFKVRDLSNAVALCLDETNARTITRLLNAPNGNVNELFALNGNRE